MLGPYWSKKLGMTGQEMLSRQASPRGGSLKVVWHEDEKEVVLAGRLR